MIRRLLVFTALLLGAVTFTGGIAGASDGNVACVYNHSPLGIGICIGI